MSASPVKELTTGSIEKQELAFIEGQAGATDRKRNTNAL